jgi:hypothetical protein
LGADPPDYFNVNLNPIRFFRALSGITVQVESPNTLAVQEMPIASRLTIRRLPPIRPLRSSRAPRETSVPRSITSASRASPRMAPAMRSSTSLHRALAGREGAMNRSASITLR